MTIKGIKWDIVKVLTVVSLAIGIIILVWQGITSVFVTKSYGDDTYMKKTEFTPLATEIHSTHDAVIAICSSTNAKCNVPK